MKTLFSTVIQNKKTLLASFRKIADFIFIPLRYLRFSAIFSNPGRTFCVFFDRPILEAKSEKIVENKNFEKCAKTRIPIGGAPESVIAYIN